MTIAPENYRMNQQELTGGKAGVDAYNKRIADLRAAETPTNVNQESNPNQLPNLPSTDSSSGVGEMSNLRVALRAALSEATARTAKNRISQVSPLLEGGAAPNVVTAAIGLAQNGLKENQNTMFNDIMTGVKEEQARKDQAKRDTLTSINQMIDNGVFGDMPDAALLTLEKQAGLPEGTTLAWKARLLTAQKQGDVKEALQLKLIQSQIDENIAQAGKARADATGDGSGGSSNANDIMQQAINAGATPEEAAREAGIAYENMGVQVTPKMLNAWTVIAKTLKKNASVAPVSTATPDNSSILSMVGSKITKPKTSSTGGLPGGLIGGAVDFFSNLFK